MIDLLVVLALGIGLGYCLGYLIGLGRALARIRALRDDIVDGDWIDSGTVDTRTVALGVMGEVLSELER